MQYLTIATALLSSFALTSAASSSSSSSHLTAKSCSVAYPESIGFPINYSISQDAGATNKQDNALSFSIPSGSWGCTLRADFPAGYPIESTGDSQVYVFDSNNSQVGTITFASPQDQVINSFTCQPQMSYRLSIGSLEEAGSVAFADIQGAGLTMTYNC
jgi:hypothetical protein